MTLVERFIEIGNWPTSRKTLFWSSILLPLHLLAWLGTWLVAHASEMSMTDRALCNAFMAAWTSAVAVSLALAVRPALAGREARWTGYAFTLLYASPVVAMVYLFNSAEVLAYVPVVVLFSTVFFDERFAAVGLIYVIVALFLSVWLEHWGLLPSAFRLLEHVTPHAIEFSLSALATLLFQTFVVVVMLCALVVSARRLQEQRLAEAHRSLAQSSALLERSTQLIRRYVPSQVADAILAGKSDGVNKHERRKLTIFFSDIVGFTDISEELEPEDLSRLLNEYFSEMTTIAQRYGGTVDELSGDAILIFFGAPHATDDQDHARRTVRMAVEMQQTVLHLNEKWRKAGIAEALQVRMGINTGVVTVGNFGSPERMKYAALGKHVNIAARIQAKCEPGRVLLSQATWLLIQDQVQCTPIGELQLKGIQRPIMIYEAVCAPSLIDQRAQPSLPTDAATPRG